MLVASTPARAANDGQVGATLSVGASDNILSSPRGTAAVAPGVFMVAAGRLRLFHDGAQSAQDLIYTGTAMLTLTENGANGQAHQLSWSGLFEQGPRVSLRFLLSSNYSRQNTSSVVRAADGTPIAVPSGPLTYLTVSGGETLTFRPAGNQVLEQALTVDTFVPAGSLRLLPTTVSVNNGLRAERQWARDALTGQLTLGFTWTPAVEDSFGEVALAQRRTFVGQLLFGWRRELSPFWTSALAAGGFATIRVESGPLFLGPAWMASLQYRRLIGTISLVVDHTPTINIFIGEPLIGDRATLQVALPIDRREQLRLTALGSYQHGRTVGGAGTAERTIDLAVAGAALSYSQLRGPYTASLDYSFQDQSGTATGTGFPLGYRRQVILLTVTGLFPRELRSSRPPQ
jgi:hypothetical protein